MIRITLFGGETVVTHLYSYEQAAAAMKAGTDLQVGGPDDKASGDDFEMPQQSIDADSIERIEEKAGWR